MNVSKFKFAFKRDGIIGFFNVLIGKFGLKFRFQTALDKRKLWLVDYLFWSVRAKLYLAILRA